MHTFTLHLWRDPFVIRSVVALAHDVPGETPSTHEQIVAVALKRYKNKPLYLRELNNDWVQLVHDGETLQAVREIESDAIRGALKKAFRE